MGVALPDIAEEEKKETIDNEEDKEKKIIRSCSTNFTTGTVDKYK